MALERLPITRLQSRIQVLGNEREAIQSVRRDLLTLFHRAQDFTLGMVFDQVAATSSDESVLTAELGGGAAVRGSFDIQVTALASATVGTSSNYLGQVVDPNVALDSAGFSLAPTSGTFTINGTYRYAQRRFDRHQQQHKRHGHV
jgi:flagellar capping protein FliD